MLNGGDGKGRQPALGEDRLAHLPSLHVLHDLRLLLESGVHHHGQILVVLSCEVGKDSHSALSFLLVKQPVLLVGLPDLSTGVIGNILGRD